MFATPIAYLIDSEGVIGADVAVGVEAIIALSERISSTMHDQILARLDGLKNELEVGQHELDKVERDRVNLRETLLRISGAIQVLEELRASGATSENGSTKLPDLLSTADSPSTRDA